MAFCTILETNFALWLSHSAISTSSRVHTREVLEPIHSKRAVSLPSGVYLFSLVQYRSLPASGRAFDVGGIRDRSRI